MLTFDSHDNLYFVDGNRIRAVTSSGLITTVVGNGDGGTGEDGLATAVALGSVAGLAVASTGDIYYSEYVGISGVPRLRWVSSTTGLVTTIASSLPFGSFSGCSALSPTLDAAEFSSVKWLAVDSADNLYAVVSCADGFYSATDRVLKITPAGVSSVFAGGGVALPGDAGPATSARLDGITNLRVGPMDTVYFLHPGPDGLALVLRSVVQAGTLATLTSSGGPIGCAFTDGMVVSDGLCPLDFVVSSSGSLYLRGYDSNPAHWQGWLGVVSGGTVDLLSSPGNPSDGEVATEVHLPRLTALAAQSDGTLFYASATFAYVRSIAPTGGELGTKAGDGTSGARAYGVPAIATSTGRTTYLHADRFGRLFLLDTSFNRVDEVTQSGTMVHFAGDGTYGNGPDGGQASATAILPVGVSTDNVGNVYILGRQDGGPGGSVVRKVAGDGVISTVYSQVGTYLIDLAWSPDGGIFLSEATSEARLLKLNPATGITTPVEIPGYFGGHIAVDAAGSVFLTDGYSVLKRATDGTVTTIDTVAESPKLALPNGEAPSLALDGGGNLYVAGLETILKYPGVGAVDTSGPRITGTVTDQNTGLPLTPSFGWQYGVVGVYTPAGALVATASVNSDGSFGIDVEPGSYVIGASDSPSTMGSKYVPEYWDDASSLGAATVVVVSPADVSGINIDLLPKSPISGQVTDATTGLPIRCTVDFEIDVRALDGTPALVSWQCSAGTYTAWVAPGSYKIQFIGNGDYQSEYFNDQLTFATAGIVAIGAGSNVSNVNATLAKRPASGLLRVTTSPAVASRVSLDGVVRSDWGLNWLTVPAGAHEVCFSDVPGFTTPPCEAVTVNEGSTTVVNGAFGQLGLLKVDVAPAGLASTVFVDGQWRDEYGYYSFIEPGEHQVCWGDVPGFQAPACGTVTVSGGSQATIVGTFTASASPSVGPAPALGASGFLRVSSSPAVPSRIVVDGVAR